MKTKRILPILMMFLVLTGFAVAEERTFMASGVEPGKWTQDLDAAKKYASEKDMPLFVMFTGSRNHTQKFLCVTDRIEGVIYPQPPGFISLPGLQDLI